MPAALSIALVVSAIATTKPTPVSPGDGAVAVVAEEKRRGASDTSKAVRGKAGQGAAAKKKAGKVSAQESEIRQPVAEPVWDTEFFVSNDAALPDYGFVRFIASY